MVLNILALQLTNSRSGSIMALIRRLRLPTLNGWYVAVELDRLPSLVR